MPCILTWLTSAPCFVTRRISYVAPPCLPAPLVPMSSHRCTPQFILSLQYPRVAMQLLCCGMYEHQRSWTGARQSHGIGSTMLHDTSSSWSVAGGGASWFAWCAAGRAFHLRRSSVRDHSDGEGSGGGGAHGVAVAQRMLCRDAAEHKGVRHGGSEEVYRLRAHRPAPPCHSTLSDCA